MKIANPLEFIEGADIGQFEALEGPAPAEPLNLDKLPDGVVSGTTLIDFSAVPNVTVRAGISLSMLFASRVATSGLGPGDDADDWLAAYTSNLGKLGFAVSGSTTVHSKFKKTGLSVHKAIIPFLTIAFGGGAIGPIILAGLKNLQDMDANSPWITLFDRETRRFNVQELHFAAVSANETDTSIRYVIARLNFASDETTILFFKLKKVNADFESVTTTMQANNSLIAVNEPKLRDRLGAMVDSFITGAKLSPA
jgi:hypothetical protein